MLSMLRQETNKMSLHVEWDREVRLISENTWPYSEGFIYIWRFCFGAICLWRCYIEMEVLLWIGFTVTCSQNKRIQSRRAIVSYCDGCKKLLASNCVGHTSLHFFVKTYIVVKSFSKS